jgi:predicted transcriptional regulator
MKAKKQKPTEERPVVQTVKLETDIFVRLKTFSAKTRRTHQEILSTALTEYLKRMRA